MIKKLRSYQDIMLTLAKLAFPITIGQLGLVLMGFADIVMLGAYDTLSMSSAGVGNAVFFLFCLIGIGALYAVATLVSIADGEDKTQQAIPIFYSSLTFSIVASILLMLLNVYFVSHFEIFGQTPQLTQRSADYLRIINYSVPALLFFNNGKMVMDGLGKTSISMYVTFVALLLNVILNSLLITGKHGFPEMGLEGAAWASVISRYLMAVMMLIWTWFHPVFRQLKTQAIIYKSYLLDIVKIGLPIGFTYFFEIAAFSFALILAGRISELHSGAHQIAINLASITYMFVMGISAAANIVVGNHYGARDKTGIRRAGFAAIYLSVIIEIVFAIVFLLFSEQMPRIYTSDPLLLEMTPILIILAAFFQLSDGLQAVAAGALRGIKDTKTTGIIAFVSYWLLMMPGAYWLCFEMNLGIQGIWISFVLGLSFAAVLLLHRFNKKTKPERLIFDKVE